MSMSIQPFKINIPQSTLDDLRERLARTRWPDEVEGAGHERRVSQEPGGLLAARIRLAQARG